MASTPLTLAETASVFGEMLTFRALLESANLGAEAVHAGLQSGGHAEHGGASDRFYRFETKVHDERRGGELLPERIGEIWRSVQIESLGPAFDFLRNTTCSGHMCRISCTRRSMFMRMLSEIVW